jgi:TrmH family RNA methyltransferase
LLISERLLRQREPRVSALLAQLEAAACVIVPVPEGVMLELSEGRNGGLLIGLCELKRGPSIEEVRRAALAGAGPVLVLVDVEEPGNVGALIRTGLASGASAAIAIGTSDPFHPKAVRTSMGSIFKLPILKTTETGSVISELAPLKRYAAVASQGKHPWQLELSGAVALFVGNESEGLRDELVAQLDGTLSIPMPSGVDSFSVNAAAAILLYEITRQSAQVTP